MASSRSVKIYASVLLHLINTVVITTGQYQDGGVFLSRSEANTFVGRNKRFISDCLENEHTCYVTPECKSETNNEYYCNTYGGPCGPGLECHHKKPCPHHTAEWECIDLDECESNPCDNGGTCYNGNNFYTCTCPADFTGTNCEIDMCEPLYPDGVDVVFVMDASRSQCQTSFTRQKEYIKDFIRDFSIGPNDTQISVVSFSLNVDVHFYLNNHTSKNDMERIIDGINCSNGPSMIGGALSKLGANVFLTSSGARSGVSKFVIVLTDGLFSDFEDAATQATALKLSYTESQIIAVGTGEQVLHAELIRIASHYTKVFPVTNRDAVNSILKSTRVMWGCSDCSRNTSDIAIVMDSSVTITYRQFYDQLDAMKTLLRAIAVSDPGIHVSYTRFGGEVLAEFDFHDFQTAGEVISATNSRLTQLTGESNVSKVLEHIRLHGFGTAARAGARKLVLLYTPATTVDNSAETEAALLKNEGVILVAVGTGRDSSLTNLLSLASDPSLVYVVGEDVNISMTALYSLIGSLEHYSCSSNLT